MPTDVISHLVITIYFRMSTFSRVAVIKEIIMKVKAIEFRTLQNVKHCPIWLGVEMGASSPRTWPAEAGWII